jgi:tartrate/fumarate subfamily iron-sulfur-dependent hydro-lyase alpha chain
MDEKFYRDLESISELLYIKALKNVPEDVQFALKKAYEDEESETGKMVIETILKNIDVARKNDIIVCQDTGTPVFLIETSEDVALNCKKIHDAISRGVSNATYKYDLRPNMLDPLTRELKGDNVGKGVPIIHFEYNDDVDFIRITCVPKGSGSENQSFLKMLSPADGLAGVIEFILESVVEGAGKACPPVIVGVGIGGTFDECAWLAKKAATMRRIDVPNRDGRLKKLEELLLNAINETGIGPMGLGGSITALAVNVETADTHISQLPVAVNLQCWKGQRAQASISKNFEVEFIL